MVIMVAQNSTTDLFVFSNTAWFITAMNGSLSALSSILVMYVIFRSSPEARSSAYHIIMFFMSFWDALASFAMALNTFPMPSDVYEVYPFAGKALGTIETCEIQGTIILMGTIFMLGSNTTLNLYYVCIFRFGMAEEKFKQNVISVMLASYFAGSFVILSHIFRMDLINPSPNGNFCSAVSYPLGCNATENLDLDDDKMRGEGLEEITNMMCIRGRNDDSMRFLLYIFVGGAFVIMVISLVCVVATVFDAELRIRNSRRSLRTSVRPIPMDHGPRNPAREIEYFMRTRTVLVQALMYISAFLLTFIWSPIILETSTNGIPSNTLVFLKLFFRPLQGFFNAMIFLYQKVHTLRRANRALTLSGALRQVVTSPSTAPQIVVSQIDIATEDIDTRRHGLDLGRYPGRPINMNGERQEIADNFGRRQFGHENNPNTPPGSVNSGVNSSSSMSSVSLAHLSDSTLEDSDDNNSLGGVSNDAQHHLRFSAPTGSVSDSLMTREIHSFQSS